MSHFIEAPWVDEKYALLLSNTLERFKITNHSPLSINFRCPICGDSKKSKTRARAYLNFKDGAMKFYCHNCGKGTNLRGLLKIIDSRMHDEYVHELLMNRKDDSITTKQVQRAKNDAPLPEPTKTVASLPTIASLDSDHPAKAYWNKRGLPIEAAKDAYWCSAYYKWINDVVIPGKFSQEILQYDRGRIVLPFRNEKGLITGYTGRALGDGTPKYVSIKTIDDEAPFGADRVDPKKTVYVVEGPFDSLFLKNCVAMGTMSRRVKYSDCVYVLDNEPRNENLVAAMRRLIDAGNRVVVWPRGMAQKDINDMKSAGLDPEEIIKSRTFSGLRANIEFAQWVKH